MKQGRCWIMVFLFCLMVTLLELQAPPEQISPNPDDYIESPMIEARADIIRWYYKSIRRKLHKRQYNASRQYWIGSWIRC